MERDGTLNLDGIEFVTFDCYGTLIDWESGILDALRPVLGNHGIERSDADLLELYATLEPEAQRGEFVPYREVLGRVMDGLGRELGFAPNPNERAVLADSIAGWEPFPDTVEALRELSRYYGLGVLSNIDDDLFDSTAERLEVAFQEVVTSEQIGSYKPNTDNFRALLERLQSDGRNVVHVAQSLYHDVVPARAAGLRTVWVNRGSRRPGSGATPKVRVTPDLEVPDLATLAHEICG